jgi:glycerol-3-phosphate dehydrogenase
MEFILPHDKYMRPAWMVRIGLFMYDNIGGKISLPGSRTVMFPDAKYSAGLKPAIRRAFLPDAQVDDARLTIRTPCRHANMALTCECARAWWQGGARPMPGS